MEREPIVTEGAVLLTVVIQLHITHLFPFFSGEEILCLWEAAKKEDNHTAHCLLLAMCDYGLFEIFLGHSKF